jgi:hypothetical protein
MAARPRQALPVAGVPGVWRPPALDRQGINAARAHTCGSRRAASGRHPPDPRAGRCSEEGIGTRRGGDDRFVISVAARNLNMPQRIFLKRKGREAGPQNSRSPLKQVIAHKWVGRRGSRTENCDSFAIRMCAELRPSWSAFKRREPAQRRLSGSGQHGNLDGWSVRIGPARVDHKITRYPFRLTHPVDQVPRVQGIVYGWVATTHNLAMQRLT